MKTIGVRVDSILLYITIIYYLEKQLEDEEALEKKLTQQKAVKFEGEDNVDSDEERKKKQKAN